MELVAYSGPETGNRDHHAFVLTSGAARFVVTGAYDPASPGFLRPRGGARYVLPGAYAPPSPLPPHRRRHGDGIADIALTVPDVDTCIAHARAAGATVLAEPHDLTDEHGTVRTAAIAT